MKVIETVYNGYRFRSRLEARWAVFFDALGLKYDYEPEGFKLPSGIWYLPDFWLQDLMCWIEIKPMPDDFDGCVWPDDKTAEFMDTSDCDVFELFGTPGFSMPGGFSYMGCTRGDSSYYWCECPSCGSVGIQFDCRAERNSHHPGCMLDKTEKMHGPFGCKILSAYNAARSARFEHGESGPSIRRTKHGSCKRRSR